jgi:hypothetical protein
MKEMMCAVAAVVLVVPAFAGDNPPGVRSLAAKCVHFDPEKAGGRPRPVEIRTAEELLKSALFVDDDARDEVKKQVSFQKEKLVVFVWGGSGQDGLAGELLKRGGTAGFTFKAGRTDDLRHHGLVFAVPRDAKVEVAK